jgi:hypothetical protein
MSVYRKSSYSVANGACVEAGQAAGVVVRDTEEDGQEYRVVLEFPVADWREFTKKLKGMPA